MKNKIQSSNVRKVLGAFCSRSLMVVNTCGTATPKNGAVGGMETLLLLLLLLLLYVAVFVLSTDDGVVANNAAADGTPCSDVVVSLEFE